MATLHSRAHQQQCCDVTVKPYSIHYGVGTEGRAEGGCSPQPPSERSPRKFAGGLSAEEDASWLSKARKLAEEEESDKKQYNYTRARIKSKFGKDIREQMLQKEQIRHEVNVHKQEDFDTAQRAISFYNSEQRNNKVKALQGRSQLAKQKEESKGLFNAMHPEGSLGKKLARKENMFQQKCFEIVAAHHDAVRKMFEKSKQVVLHKQKLDDIEMHKHQNRILKLEDDIACKRVELMNARMKKQERQLKKEMDKKNYKIVHTRQVNQEACANTVLSMSEDSERRLDASSFEDKKYPFQQGDNQPDGQSPKEVQKFKQERMKAGLDKQQQELRKLIREKEAELHIGVKSSQTLAASIPKPKTHNQMTLVPQPPAPVDGTSPMKGGQLHHQQQQGGFVRDRGVSMWGAELQAMNNASTSPRARNGTINQPPVSMMARLM